MDGVDETGLWPTTTSERASALASARGFIPVRDARHQSEARRARRAARGERCEARGDWYDIETRTCATPIYVPDITGRPAGVSRAEASNAKNRELIELEAQVAQQRRAVDAAVARERQDLKAREGL